MVKGNLTVPPHISTYYPTHDELLSMFQSQQYTATPTATSAVTCNQYAVANGDVQDALITELKEVEQDLKSQLLARNTNILQHNIKCSSIYYAAQLKRKEDEAMIRRSKEQTAAVTSAAAAAIAKEISDVLSNNSKAINATLRTYSSSVLQLKRKKDSDGSSSSSSRRDILDDILESGSYVGNNDDDATPSDRCVNNVMGYRGNIHNTCGIEFYLRYTQLSTPCWQEWSLELHRSSKVQELYKKFPLLRPLAYSNYSDIPYYDTNKRTIIW